MNHEETDQVAFLTIIVNRKLRDALLSDISDFGIPAINTIYGRGTVKASYIQNVLGLVPEENKVVITCLLPYEKAMTIMDRLIEKFNFDKPNTGIAFASTISKLSF